MRQLDRAGLIAKGHPNREIDQTDQPARLERTGATRGL